MGNLSCPDVQLGDIINCQSKQRAVLTAVRSRGAEAVAPLEKSLQNKENKKLQLFNKVLHWALLVMY